MPSIYQSRTKWHDVISVSSVSLSWIFVHLIQQKIIEIPNSEKNSFSETSFRSILNIAESRFCICGFFKYYFLAFLKWMVSRKYGVCFWFCDQLIVQRCLSYRMFLARSLGEILFIINDINNVAVFSVTVCIFTVFVQLFMSF